MLQDSEKGVTPVSQHASGRRWAPSLVLEERRDLDRQAGGALAGEQAELRDSSSTTGLTMRNAHLMDAQRAPLVLPNHG